MRAPIAIDYWWWIRLPVSSGGLRATFTIDDSDTMELDYNFDGFCRREAFVDGGGACGRCTAASRFPVLKECRTNLDRAGADETLTQWPAYIRVNPQRARVLCSPP